MGIDGNVQAQRVQVKDVAITGSYSAGGACTTIGYLQIVVGGQVKRMPYCN